MPYFSVEHLPAFATFLQHYPTDLPLAVEFRHASWFQYGQFATVARLLAQDETSTVITDVAGRREVFYMRLTTATAVICLVGMVYYKPQFWLITSLNNSISSVKARLNRYIGIIARYKLIYFQHFMHCLQAAEPIY